LVEARDIVLLISVFGAHENNRIEGRTRIQKEICLLKHSSRLPFSFDFKPYYYGPYSEELSETINTLVGLKLLKETITPVSFDSFRYNYTLTEQGRQLFQRIQRDFGELVDSVSEEARKLEEVKTSDLVFLAKKISGIESLS